MPELHGFIQRDTEHVVEGYEMVFVLMENLLFFFGQPGTPVLPDRSTAGTKGAAAVFHGRSPLEQGPQYTKSILPGNTFLNSCVKSLLMSSVLRRFELSPSAREISL